MSTAPKLAPVSNKIPEGVPRSLLNALESLSLTFVCSIAQVVALNGSTQQHFCCPHLHHTGAALEVDGGLPLLNVFLPPLFIVMWSLSLDPGSCLSTNMTVEAENVSINDKASQDVNDTAYASQDVNDTAYAYQGFVATCQPRPIKAD
ncbi:hypothetical protein PoB_007713600 [Plakobranchus ocellatus]|uniref:Uncharacterized protein n=1 Tax=Plakobranchus ocellatus TaxID=259542 RepID=A0AAV4E2S6_9GAST|nr:hypothetical protein PoB_007713600 [Plakobranchus ocellatus]